MSRLWDWLHESRIQGAGGFAAAFTTAAYLGGMRGWLLLLPVVAGVFIHCFGFAHNQWEDRVRDRADKTRPLGAFSAGRIREREAKTGLALLLLLGMAPIVYASYLRADEVLLVWWAVAVAFAVAYNRYGKLVNRWAGLGFYVIGTVLSTVNWGLVWARGWTSEIILFAAVLVPASAVGLFAGDYKDIDVCYTTGEGNLWKVFGVKASKGWDKARAVRRANTSTAVALLMVPLVFIEQLGWEMWLLVSILPFVWFVLCRPLHYWRV